MGRCTWDNGSVGFVSLHHLRIVPAEESLVGVQGEGSITGTLEFLAQNRATTSITAAVDATPVTELVPVLDHKSGKTAKTTNKLLNSIETHFRTVEERPDANGYNCWLDIDSWCKRDGSSLQRLQLARVSTGSALFIPRDFVRLMAGSKPEIQPSLIFVSAVSRSEPSDKRSRCAEAVTRTHDFITHPRGCHHLFAPLPPPHTHTHTHTRIHILPMFNMYTPPYPGSTRGQTNGDSLLTKQRPQFLTAENNNVVSVFVAGFETMFVFCGGLSTHGECLLDFEMDASMVEHFPLLQLLALPCAVVWSKGSSYCLVQLVELFEPSEAQKKKDADRTVSE